MKRFSMLLLAAAACLTLGACGGKAPAPAAPEPSPAAPEPPAAEAPLQIASLNVEFAVGGRDAGVMLKLREEFPQLLIDALAEQNVALGAASVTFGTSGEATQTAMREGAVQLAFLPAEDYYPYRSGLIVAIETGDPALSRGLIVLAASDDAAADERLAAALRDALPALRSALAPYTGEPAAGVYGYDAAAAESLGALYEAESAQGKH